MIVLVDYNPERIILENRCNSINPDRVTSSIIKIENRVCGLSENQQEVQLNQSQTLSFIEGTQMPFNLLIKDDDYTELIFSVYTSLIYPIESFGVDYIEGSNVLNNFVDTDYLSVNGIEYNINKTNSTQNKVYVNRPFTTTVSNVLIVSNYKEYLFPIKSILKQIESKIANISNICDCDTINKTTDYVLKFMSLSSALKCCDRGKSLELYKFLKW